MNSRRIVALAYMFVAVIAAMCGRIPAFSETSIAVRSFEFTYVTKIPALPGGAKISRIWIPVPQSDADQTISGLKIESPFPYAPHREAEYGNGYVYLEVPAAEVASPHVLVVGHPYVDIWQAVKPAALGIPAWPVIPRGTPWKEGVLSALGWGTDTDTAAGWKRILASARSYADLESELLGRVEELIDFVTAPGTG